MFLRPGLQSVKVKISWRILNVFPQENVPFNLFPYGFDRNFYSFRISRSYRRSLYTYVL